MKKFIRKELFDDLWKVLAGKINTIQAVIGPRQVGKTTLALQVLDKWHDPKIYETADQPMPPSHEWIINLWQEARKLYKRKKQPVLLILDEIQKVSRWSEIVKKLYDEDRRFNNNVRTVLLGSSALLMQRGLSESLAGRFELHRHNQWSFKECKECFSVKLDEFLFFGGYPGALAMRKDEHRWTNYMRDSLIETVLSKDILLLTPVTKPILLRQAFGFAVNNAACILSYQKMLGSLQDAGNTTTIASYLNLLSKAFLLSPLERWSGSRVRQRGSIPKILVFDNGIISALSGLNFVSAKEDKFLWGRMIENAVGASLYFLCKRLGGDLFYWRERDNEVDYVLKTGNKIIGIEVKSGNVKSNPAAISAFKNKYKNSEVIIISNSKKSIIDNIVNINLHEFFENANIVIDTNLPFH